MSYFISSNDQNKLNNKVKNLEIEKNKINDNLVKYYNDLKYLKKHIVFSLLKRYRLKLENLISKEEVLRANNSRSIELIKEINSKLKDLIVVMHTKGDDKSIFDENVYYECMDLYNTLSLNIYELCNSIDMSVVELGNLNNLIDNVYNYYQDVNFDELDLDTNNDININFDDFNLYDDNSSFIEYICNCFKNKIKYEEFIVNAKKYLTIRKSLYNVKVRKVSKKV